MLFLRNALLITLGNAPNMLVKLTTDACTVLLFKRFTVPVCKHN